MQLQSVLLSVINKCRQIAVEAAKNSCYKYQLFPVYRFNACYRYA